MKIKNLIKHLEEIYTDLLTHDAQFNEIAAKLHPRYQLSGLNLCRYLLLRTYDLRKVHGALSEYGISSLRAPENYTYRNVADALKLLHLLKGDKDWDYDREVTAIGYRKSQKLLRKHKFDLFGNQYNSKSAHIMVTLPSEAAEDRNLVKELIAAGMDIARINMSHDDQEAWQKMIRNVEKASKQLNKSCRIYVDLAGPKIRTGSIPVFEKKKKKKKVIDYLQLGLGDQLWLYREEREAHRPETNEAGEIIKPAGISVTLPAIIDDIVVGDRVFFDDGKIMGMVASKHADHIELVIQRTGVKKAKLKAQKGINVPDTHLNLPSLTEDDRTNLPFVAKYADIVGYSFVRSPEDVQTLQKELEKLGAEDIGMVLKIENQEAFTNLPQLLLTAMRSRKVGVMIARGDLAVELGFSRISEVQEQILWLCEAAHIPVIWATQVLEGLAKTGRASRAEITDAAMSGRAECVMLNKGPYIVETCQVLQDILMKMEKHQSKKKTRLRPLKLAINALPRLEGK